MVAAGRRRALSGVAWRSRSLLFAGGGGVCFALTAPPTNAYPAVVVGLALLAASLLNEGHRLPGAPKRPPGVSSEAPTPGWLAAFSCARGPTFGWHAAFARGFGRGALWGTAAGLIGLRFVPTVIQRFTSLGVLASLAALVLLAAAQSLIWGIGGGVATVLASRLRVSFEVAFGAGVLVALSLPSIFLWSPAGLVSPWPTFVQLADVVGERGVSVLFAIGAAAVARAIVARSWRRGLAGSLVFVALPLYGQLRIASIEGASAGAPIVRVGLVDQAVDPLDRWNPANYPAILRSLRTLTAEVEGQGADLTVWPEAAYPYTVGHEDRRAPGGPRSVLGRDVHGPVLFGLITTAAPERLPSGEIEQNTFNSTALVASPGVISAPSDKLQLLWFGETVPGGAYFPWLRRLFQRSGALLPGVVPRAQELGPSASGAPATRMAILNCYEDTLPDLGRRVANELEPQLLVNVTNDAWFGGTAAPELHARLAVMRAIELRIDLVRAVNRGVTSWIDAAGVVRAHRSDPSPGTILVTPAVRPYVRTPYAIAGDAPLLVILTVAAALSARFRRNEA